MADERRYDEREVGLILKRVTELHEGAGAPADARAMTRGEIEDVVAELGISRALVARAAAEVAVHDRNREVWAVGGKTDVVFEEVIAGPVDEARLTAMLEVLRRHLGDPGELRSEGGARIWSPTAALSRRIHFSVVPRADGTTTLRLEERMEGSAGAAIFVTAGAGGMLGFFAALPIKFLVGKLALLLAWPPLIALGAVLGWLLGRTIWRREAGRREALLRRAFVDLLAEAGPQPALAEASDEGDEP